MTLPLTHKVGLSLRQTINFFIKLAVLVLFAVSIVSAMPYEEWNRTYGNALSSIADVKAVDDGFILAGFTGSTYDSDAWIIRTDAQGNEVWNVTFGGGEIDVASSIQKVADGYIIAGLYGGAFGDGWLVKIDFNGNLLWSKTYGGRDYERFWWVEVVDDGFVIAGEKKSWGKPSDAWLVKTDFEGNVVWSRTYGGEGDDAALCVRKVEDGFIIAGFTESFSAKDAWLLKVDSEGNEVWNATFGGGLDDSFSSVQVITDGFILAGYTQSIQGKKDALVIKVDKTGREVWNATFGGKRDDEASAVIPVSDGYVIAGFTESFTESFGADRDGWLIKINRSGNVVWNVTFGGKGRESFSSIVKTSDGYALAGSKEGRGWLVRVVEGELTEEVKSTPGFEVPAAVTALVITLMWLTRHKPKI